MKEEKKCLGLGTFEEVINFDLRILILNPEAEQKICCTSWTTLT